MTVREFLHLPPVGVFRNFTDVMIYTRQVRDALFRLRQGKIECVAEITLTANVALTTFDDRRLTPQSVVSFDPKTANAAAEKAAGTMYVETANRQNFQWVIAHANNAQTDRTFQVSIIG